MGGRVGLPGFLFFGAGVGIIIGLFGMPRFGAWALDYDVMEVLSFCWVEVVLIEFPCVCPRRFGDAVGEVCRWFEWI